MHTTLILAMSLDGKISDYQRQAARFSSSADLAHLEARVAEADGVLFGGGTLRAYGTTLSVRSSELLEQRRQQGLSPQPLQIVWSPSGNLDADFRFFKQPVPRGLLTTAAGAERWRQGDRFQHIWEIPPAQDNPWNWGWTWEQFTEAGMSRLALLGGGRLTAELLRSHLIDDIYITLCPLVLGGANSPSPVDGEGFLTSRAPRLTLLSSRVVGEEVFLHYQVCK